MSKNTISGQRQMDFVSKFNYIREAGTPSEEKGFSDPGRIKKLWHGKSYRRVFL